MTLHWPQITLLLLTALSLGISLSEHGKPKTGTNNFTYSLIGSVITVWLLYMGGFFSQP